MCLEIGLRIWGPEYHRSGTSREPDIEPLEGDTVLMTFVYEYDSNPRGYFDIKREEDERVIYGLEIRCVAPRFRRVPESIDKREDVLAFLAREDKVLALGDSFTEGQGVKYEDTYVQKLEKLLAKEGTPITIRNTGVAGSDLEEVCMAYDDHSAERHYPLVVYGFVLNDFGLPGRERIIGSDYIDTNNGGNEYRPWRRRCASINFIHHCLDNIRLDQMTRNGYLEAFRGKNARDKFELLRGLDRKIQSEGGKLVIVLFPLLHDFHDYPFQEIHDKIQDFCQQNDIPLLDLLPSFSQHEAESLWVHPSDYHPNSIAHQLAAEEICSFLRDQGLLETLAADVQ